MHLPLPLVEVCEELQTEVVNGPARVAHFARDLGGGGAAAGVGSRHRANPAALCRRWGCLEPLRQYVIFLSGRGKELPDFPGVLKWQESSE